MTFNFSGVPSPNNRQTREPIVDKLLAEIESDTGHELSPTLKRVAGRIAHELISQGKNPSPVTEIAVSNFLDSVSRYAPRPHEIS